MNSLLSSDKTFIFETLPKKNVNIQRRDEKHSDKHTNQARLCADKQTVELFCRNNFATRNVESAFEK